MESYRVQLPPEAGLSEKTSILRMVFGAGGHPPSGWSWTLRDRKPSGTDPFMPLKKK